MKPILFNTAMVKAIRQGDKSVTRRVVKPQPVMYGFLETYFDWRGIKAPYRPGDILWVRETWNGLPANERAGIPAKYWYKADEPEDADTGVLRERWHPSIHMPYAAARIFLRVTDVRVERLQEIQERGPLSATAEGFVNDIDIINGGGKSASKHFAELWDSTIKKADLDLYGWDANPWVWVIEFEVISREDAE